MTYEESMNTVLIQELIRYNRLVAVVESSLKNVLNAIEGLVVMNNDLEQIFLSLLNNQVPEIFHKVFFDLVVWLSISQTLRRLVQ